MYDPREPNSYDDVIKRRQDAVKRRRDEEEHAAKLRTAAAAQRAALQEHLDARLPPPPAPPPAAFGRHHTTGVAAASANSSSSSALTADEIRRQRIAVGSRMGVAGAAELEMEEHEVVLKERKAAAADSGTTSRVQRMMAAMGHVEGRGLGKDGSGIAAPLEATKSSLLGTSGHIIAPGAVKPSRPPVRGKPSATLLIRNTCAPGRRTPDATLQDDMLSECAKYGVVRGIRVHVEPEESGDCPPAEWIRVVVRFDSVASAFKASEAIHYRLFDGRHAIVSFFPTSNFDKGIFSRQPDEVPVAACAPTQP